MVQPRYLHVLSQTYAMVQPRYLHSPTCKQLRQHLTHTHSRANLSRRTHTDFLSAATAKALTMVFAGFALTITILPKISLLPAFVAGFRRVLIMHKPGIVHFPVFFTSREATLVNVSSTFTTCDFFSSVPSARACAKAPLLIGLPPFMAFIAFIGAMAVNGGGKTSGRTGAE